MSTLDYHRKYAWDWLAILLLMVVLVITEELKPFEKSIYNETDQVSSNSVFLQYLPRCRTVSVTSSMKLVVSQDIQAEPLPTAGLLHGESKASRCHKLSHLCPGDVGNMEV